MTSAVTDERGQYQTAPLAPGLHRVEASLDGFQTIIRRVTAAAGQTPTLDFTLAPATVNEALVVTARRTEEVAQEVPIPVSVVGGALVADAGDFNVNRLKELLPTVQFYSTNPRNSAINIRGLGAPFGLTNDGIEQGVGLYIDGVYYARPAAATLDFLDVERVEVLRGPQGTLFGKNTTAGAINVTTRKPEFTPDHELELTYGSYDFGRRRARSPGRSARKVAGRLSFSSTQRGGVINHVATGDDVNDLSNLGGARPGALRPQRSHRRSTCPSTTRGSGRRATRRWSPAWRRRCVRPTASTRRSRPTSATPRRASTPSIASPTPTRRCSRTRISAASRSTSTGSSVPAG